MEITEIRQEGNCMKKVISVCLIVLMGLLTLTSCGNSQKEEDACTIVANYSVHNFDDDAADKEFIVEIQNLGGVYKELYDEDGLYIKFKNGEKIVDTEGNPVDRDDLTIGTTLQISYDGKLAKNNPKTIKAYKVTVLD